MTATEKTMKVTYNGTEITPDEFDAEIHTVETLIVWYISLSGWVTIPVNYPNENQLCDDGELAEWAAQWGI